MRFDKIPKGSIKSVLDIGANTGQFYKEFIREFPDAKFDFVEPNKDCANQLQHYPGTVHCLGLSKEDGTLKFYTSAKDKVSTGNSIYIEQTPHFTVSVEVTIPVRKLDTFFASRQFDLIKIDTQGSEYDILLGGKNVLQKANWLIVEISFLQYNKDAPGADVILDKLREYGFAPSDFIEYHYYNVDTFGRSVIQTDMLFKNENT